ncbi:MAG: sodium:proton antiporter, partial [Erythrobacter sp.]|nr:sodium:proton antiporter [Erythrobacter sp.]
RGAAIGIALIFIIRPLAGLLSESVCNLPFPGKLAVAFLGVRGMGSIYYLAYGQNHGKFFQFDQLWAIASFTILVSIIVHGVVAGPLIRMIEERKWHIHLGEDEGLPSLSPDNPTIMRKSDRTS